MVVSIITPSFNSENCIFHCLESVRNQSYKNIEHLLIDGASRDDTLKIAKTYSHISKIISETDHGIYDAINKGIRLASGQIIAILNSDDYYSHPLVLKKVMEAFENQDVDIVYGDLNYVDKTDPGKIVRKWRSGEYNKDRFLKGWMPPHPAFFIRKSCYTRYGAYNTSLNISADYELMLRMLYRYELSCVYLPEVLVAMRMGGKSNSSWHSRWKANQEDRLAWKMNGLKPGPFTLLMKPLRKLGQFF